MKEKITFLDIVVPLSCIYLAFLLIYTWFMTPKDDNIMDMIIVFTASAVFMYGVLALIRDLKLFGFKWMLKSWRKIFKSK